MLGPMSGSRGIALTIRFLCELGMLAGLAYWGFRVGDGTGAWLLGIGAPILAVAALATSLVNARLPGDGGVIRAGRRRPG